MSELSPSPEKISPTPERQLPIEEHKYYQRLDDFRSRWETLNESEKNQAEREAKELVERHLSWWDERPSKGENNVYSWSNANILSAALLLDKAGRKEEATEAIEQTKGRFYDQVRRNVYEDGSSLDFRERDSVHYHLFNEAAWLKSANYLREYGEKIPQDVEEKLKKSIEFCEPYLAGEKTHLEFVNSQNRLDALRHPEWAGKPFNPQEHEYVVGLLEGEVGRSLT